jgi:hypothetical protein
MKILPAMKAAPQHRAAIIYTGTRIEAMSVATKLSGQHP